MATIEIHEPLGFRWPDEWVSREVNVARSARVADLHLLGGDDEEIAFEVRSLSDHRAIPPSRGIEAGEQIEVFFRAALSPGETALWRLVSDSERDRAWAAVEIERVENATLVRNGAFELELERNRPAVLDGLRIRRGSKSLLRFRWPEDVHPESVEDLWSAEGPARVIVRRIFSFAEPALRYEITFEIRAGDPWIDVDERCALGRGAIIALDLEPLEATHVYHPHTYNARTYRPDGKPEDSTLEPPEHPIATLGPVWHDIWFGGGPFAFVYREGGEAGIGLAAVHGSEWDTVDGVSLPSQVIEIHGDRIEEGRVRARFPADGGRRRWALVAGPPELRHGIAALVRARADVPLERALDEWVLDWPSDARRVDYPFAEQWFGMFHRHELNPTTFPRRVRSFLDGRFDGGRVREELASRDLAFLAYIFTDPDYWPGPERRWGNVGNPNFHTDMYNVPLKIGLLMPDHPHAKRWIDYGVAETKENLARDSFPGGAWAESISYAGFFFHIVENARKLRDAGVARPFRDWPRLARVARYLGILHGPPDPRYGSRQKAPIGDTSPGNYIDEINRLADDYRGIDERLAKAFSRFPEGGPDALDIESAEFPGFGAVLRGNPYSRFESFVTVKAGPARNHFQGDELSFHFASLSVPLAIDHACHYSPRPWHAAMHNRPDMNGKRPVAVAVPRAFVREDGFGSVFVAEERTRRMSHVPLEPHEATKPGWEYPWSETPAEHPWTMRRYVFLVEHDPSASRLADYVVIRDEIDSPEPVRWNLHVLARSMERNAQDFRFPGQLGVDLGVHFLAPELGEVEAREWGWRGDSKKRRELHGKDYERECFGAWIPEDLEEGTWDPKQGGEMTKWLRAHGSPGRSEWFVVLVPYRSGGPAPKVERLSATSARITIGNESEVIFLGTEAKPQAAIERNGERTVLIPAETVPLSDRVEFPPSIEKGDPDRR